MNLVIDIGNSYSKAGLFAAAKLIREEAFNSVEALKKFMAVTAVENLIVSSVHHTLQEVVTSSIAS